MHYNYCVCAPQQEKAPQWEACAPQLESGPCLSQLEKSPGHSEDPEKPHTHKKNGAVSISPSMWSTFLFS